MDKTLGQVAYETAMALDGHQNLWVYEGAYTQDYWERIALAIKEVIK